jgi:putative FmdB family regulatory protein
VPKAWGQQVALYLSHQRRLSCVEAEAMPTYAYRCEQCRETFERIETISEHETAKPQCPNCGSDEVVSVPTPFVAITGKKS